MRSHVLHRGSGRGPSQRQPSSPGLREPLPGSPNLIQEQPPPSFLPPSLPRRGGGRSEGVHGPRRRAARVSGGVVAPGMILRIGSWLSFRLSWVFITLTSTSSTSSSPPDTSIDVRSTPFIPTQAIFQVRYTTAIASPLYRPEPQTPVWLFLSVIYFKCHPFIMLHPSHAPL